MCYNIYGDSMKIGIIGAGKYALALASILSDNKQDITIYSKIKDEIDSLEKDKPDYLKNAYLTNNLEECIKNNDLILVVIPATFTDSIFKDMSKYLDDTKHICIATKGIDPSSFLLMHELLDKYYKTNNLSILSGPSFAIDIFDKMPVGLSLATRNSDTGILFSKAFSNNYIKIRINDDVIGTELCGTLKNVMALATGILTGLKANESTKAMFITESLHDIKNIIEIFGGNTKTIQSFAGIGDLILTCTSPKSRNFKFGTMLGEDMSQEEINDFLKNNTVEGVNTVTAFKEKLAINNQSSEIIDLINDIIIGNKKQIELLNFLIDKE